MTRYYFKAAIMLALFATAGFLSNATVIYQYGFENLPGNNVTTATPWTGTPDVLATGLSASSWATNYTGGLFISYAGSCGTTSCQALSISHNNYPATTTYTLTFTITPGYSLNLTDISFWNRESTDGPTTANITINGTPAHSNLALAGTTGANTGALTPTTSFTNLTGTFTLVMTLSGATTATGTFRLDDFVIDGTVSNAATINTYAVTGGGSLCAGATGVAIGLASSDTGVTYQLKNSSNANVGSPVAGTGSAISFGPQAVAGTYTVVATSNTTLATANMTGSATIVVNALPVVSLGTPPAQCGGTVTLDAGNAGSTFLWSNSTTAETVVASASGSYTVTVTNGNQCSASASVLITINAPPVITFNPATSSICTNGSATITASGATSYLWSNSVTTASITVQPTSTTPYTVTGSNGGNCTATATTTVTVSSSITNTVTTQICQGLTYYGHASSGTFIDTFSVVGGCDSIRTLNLTVLPASNSTTTRNICAGQSYGGHSTSGSYSDTLQSVNGCDSIVTLQLTVSTVITTSVTTSICSGQNYAGHTANGTYTDTLTASTGCDSVRTLNLTVLSAVQGSATSQTICNGTNYNGYTVSGVYNDTLSSVNGCDSIVALTLTVLPQPSTAFSRSICQYDTFMGHTTTGVYSDTLTASSGCDSIIYLNLTVHTLPHVTLYLTFDTVCNNAAPITMTGGLPANGYYTGTGISNGIFTPSNATLGWDTIYYNYTDSNGCFKHRYEYAHTIACTDSTDSTLSIHEAALSTFNVLPNPAQDYITIESTGFNAEGVIAIYDMLGRVVLTQAMENNTAKGKTMLNLHHLSAGVYLLNIVQGNSKVYSCKVVKN